MQGTIVQINRSAGGVPKTAIREVEITTDGLVGDRVQILPACANIDLRLNPESSTSENQ